MKESMSKAGYTQGAMEPKVKDYQKPASDFSQEGFSKTLEYVERQDAFQAKEAKEIKSQAYKGRYS
ncbi:MAG TPA: hypothetical protein VIJ14_08055 [Rhabdochlamydiaceae bacterium]